MPCALCGTENDPSSRFCAGCGTPLTPVASPSAGGATRTAETPQGRTGRLFAGRYRIIEEIGRGGMGRVFTAFDTRIEEKIAFKVIDPEGAGDAGCVARFTRELKQARRVSHPNVCRLFDIGETEGAAYITMEYVPGESLHTMIRMTGRLDSRTAAGYGRQIALGLAETHRQGIVHRDLKPQNIMVLPDGTVKIMDFGIARSEEEPGLTREHRVVGTPGYMSPEQSAGRSVDARSDIYALGLILYEMTTGRLPAAGAGRAPAPPPAAVHAEIPARLSDIILKCLRAEPEGRYAAAERVAAELEPLAAPAGTGTGAPLPLTPPRRRVLPIALAAAAALGITIGTFVLIKSRRDRESPSLPPPAWNNRLAVLPIQGRSLPADKALGDGLAEFLRNEFERQGIFGVIARFSCEKFRDTREELVDIGRALKARYVLSGNLETAGDRLSMNLALDDVETLQPVWTKNSSESRDGLFKAAGLFADGIADRLGFRRLPRPGGGSRAPEPANLRAFEKYCSGRFSETAYRDHGADEDFAEAEKEYLSALNLDPRYARALCGLGDLYEARYVKKDRTSDLQAMLQFYRRAQALDPNDAEIALGQGWTSFYLNDPDGAYAQFKKAYELQPGNARVNLDVGAFLRSLGLYRQALVFLDRAGELDPLSSNPVLQTVSCQFFLGKYVDGLNRTQAVARNDVENPRIPLYAARQYLALGLADEAEKAIRNSEALGDIPAGTINRYRAWLAALRGDRQGALRAVREADRAFAYEICNAYCLLKMPREALSCIRDGIENGPTVVKELTYTYLVLQQNPLFKFLENDSEFIRLRDRQKARYEEMETKYSRF